MLQCEDGEMNELNFLFFYSLLNIDNCLQIIVTLLSNFLLA